MRHVYLPNFRFWSFTWTEKKTNLKEAPRNYLSQKIYVTPDVLQSYMVTMNDGNTFKRNSEEIRLTKVVIPTDRQIGVKHPIPRYHADSFRVKQTANLALAITKKSSNNSYFHHQTSGLENCSSTLIY